MAKLWRNYFLGEEGHFIVAMFPKMQTAKILVVDDDISLVQLSQLILEDMGYTVRGAVSGSQALVMIAEDMPDLILLDVMMPQMDGFAVCRKIRKRYLPPIPYILMYTADDREETYLKSLEAGANDLITKDTPISELAAKIEVLLAALPLGEA